MRCLPNVRLPHWCICSPQKEAVMLKENGFSLIEMLVAIAVVGVLAALALPTYSSYQARTKLMSALVEISALKTSVQISLDQGVDTNAPTDVGGASTTGNCSSISAVAVATTGAGSIICTIANGPGSVLGQTITWTRVQATGWTCSTSAPASLAPKTCPGN